MLRQYEVLTDLYPSEVESYLPTVEYTRNPETGRRDLLEVEVKDELTGKVFVCNLEVQGVSKVELPTMKYLVRVLLPDRTTPVGILLLKLDQKAGRYKSYLEVSSY